MQRDIFRELNAFATVARERSFTKAAAALGVSQSALSHTVRRLEERVGVRLLSRTTRSVAPTAAGDRLQQTLAPALESIERELLALGELRDVPGGRIRINAARHAVETVLWPKLRHFLRDYPEIEVELSVDSGFAYIVEGRFDAGVRLGEAVDKDMIAVRIGPDLRMVIVGAPAYLAHAGTPHDPAELAAHTCIALRFKTSRSIYAWELEKGARALNVRPHGRLVFDSTPQIVQAAIDGFGLAFVMQDEVQPAIDAGLLVPVMEDWCPSFGGYHLYYPSKRQSSAAFVLMVDALRHRD